MLSCYCSSQSSIPAEVQSRVLELLEVLEENDELEEPAEPPFEVKRDFYILTRIPYTSIAD